MLNVKTLRKENKVAFPTMMQGDNIVLFIDGEQHTVTKGNVNYDMVVEAMKNNDWDEVRRVIHPERAVLDFGDGNIEIQGERLFWQGRELDNSLVRKIIDMVREGFDVTPMVKFMDNLMENPSMTAVNELYKFLEVGVMPITPDGHFLAFKRVKEDYMDCHSGSVFNKPVALMTEEERAEVDKGEMSGKRGEVTVAVENGELTVSMPRNAVDDQRNRTCSAGLHFCSRDYLNNFYGERIVVLKINPADVVSIPADYNDTKGRTWRYQVIGEVESNPDNALRDAVQVGA